MNAISLPFKDRSSAGRALAKALQAYRGRGDVLVLALPRGGLPVACEVAEALGAELDLMLVRKLGTPGQEELAMGAIASGGIRVLNPDVIGPLGIPEQVIARVEAGEKRELERRERAYRGTRPRAAVAGGCVILVDDGVATGATMRAAIAALRQQGPARIVVAVPVAPADTVMQLKREADEVVCLAMPEDFMAIAYWYEEFSQLSDEDVRDCLARAWRRQPEGTAAGRKAVADPPTV
jgi:putative phosphoribosyl transferase